MLDQLNKKVELQKDIIVHNHYYHNKLLNSPLYCHMAATSSLEPSCYRFIFTFTDCLAKHLHRINIFPSPQCILCTVTIQRKKWTNTTWTTVKDVNSSTGKQDFSVTLENNNIYLSTYFSFSRRLY